MDSNKALNIHVVGDVEKRLRKGLEGRTGDTDSEDEGDGDDEDPEHGSGDEQPGRNDQAIVDGAAAAGGHDVVE